MTHILIVEDHPLFCDALERAICTANGVSDITKATSIDEALDILTPAQGVDLILLDLSMPGTTGLAGVIQIRKTFPKTPVMIVSAFEDIQIVRSVLALGVSGYMPKSMSKAELADAIAEVLRGGIYLPERYRAMVSVMRGRAGQSQLLQRLHDLTPQQLRVLDMVRRGLQNKQIAFELKICETTVKVHVSDILRKLNVPNRTNAIIEMSKIDFAALAETSAQQYAIA